MCSPLARGTHRTNLFFPVPVRFIPAGAGNTGTMNGSALMPAVYPRWRGEHGKATPFFIDLAGLSPLARGTPRRRNEYYVSKRFIPAGAGNTWWPQINSSAGAVYPRWRGEHSTWTRSYSTAAGLSPLARGTQRHMAHRHHPIRFIPAGAGNTNDQIRNLHQSPVYPRWRGEH